MLASDVLRVWRVLWFNLSDRSLLRHSYMRENACIFIWVSVCDQALMYDGGYSVPVVVCDQIIRCMFAVRFKQKNAARGKFNSSFITLRA